MCIVSISAINFLHPKMIWIQHRFGDYFYRLMALPNDVVEMFGLNLPLFYVFVARQSCGLQ